MNQSSAVFSDLGLRLVVADISLVSPDFSLIPLLSDLDIHGDDKYIPIEFAGAVSAVVFSVSAPYSPLSPLFLFIFILFILFFFFFLWFSLFIVSLIFSLQWLYLMMTPYFSPRKDYDLYD